MATLDSDTPDVAGHSRWIINSHFPRHFTGYPDHSHPNAGRLFHPATSSKKKHVGILSDSTLFSPDPQEFFRRNFPRNRFRDVVHSRARCPDDSHRNFVDELSGKASDREKDRSETVRAFSDQLDTVESRQRSVDPRKFMTGFYSCFFRLNDENRSNNPRRIRTIGQ